MSPKFKVGDHVKKEGGDYYYEGVIVSIFQKLTGAIRFIVEDERGLLFIFNESNLKKVDK